MSASAPAVLVLTPPPRDVKTTRGGATTLSDYGRKLRDEPYYYVFRHKLWLEQDAVSAEQVVKWLRMRYVRSKSGHRYRVKLYKAKDGQRYLDYVLLETVTDQDLAEMRLRGWNWSDREVKRGNRLPLRRLTREQRRNLDKLIAEVTEQFYESL